MAGTTSPWADRRSFFGQQVQSEAYGVSTATAHDLIKAINGRNEKIATINAVRPAVVNNIAAQTLMNCINSISQIVQANPSPRPPVHSASQQKDATAAEEMVNTPSLR